MFLYIYGERVNNNLLFFGISNFFSQNNNANLKKMAKSSDLNSEFLESISERKSQHSMYSVLKLKIIQQV